MVRPTCHRAFTLVELLVVVVIVLLVSAVTLPAIIPALSHRQVSEGARLLQGQLVQARDTAIRFNAPRGVRFLPDPTYANSTSILAYNRMLPIEPGPEYSNGLATVWPAMFDLAGNQQVWYYQSAAFPPAYPTGSGIGNGGVYPIHPPGSTGNSTIGQVLMIEQAPLQGNSSGTSAVPAVVNPPTSWWWNVRVGDQIQLNNSGQIYTIVGPCTINPFSGGANPELFVNNGLPGDTSGLLQRTYTAPGGANPQKVLVEFLLLVNGIDDDHDGYTDNGWDGVDNNRSQNYNTLIDDQGTSTIPTEWEQETFLGTAAGLGKPIAALATYDTTSTAFLPAPMNYTISRRPVPSQSARETTLPNNVVIDATSWNSTHERSRLPVDPFSKYVDIMLLPSGQVVPTTLYSNPASFTLGASFYQFWITERGDVHELTDVWGATSNPNNGLSFLLPMPQDAYNAYVSGGGSWTTAPTMALTGERMLVTLFSRTGQLTNTSIEFFNVNDVNTPFYDSQLAAREGK